MKLQTIFLSFLLLISTLGNLAIANAEPSLIPHEDPSTIKGSIDAYSLLTEYAAVFSFMSNRQYQNASTLSAQLNQLTVPSDLSYIISRYNQLTRQLISTLNELQSNLDNATVMLRQNRLSEVEPILNRAGVLVAQAQILIEDLQEATETVSQRLGIFAASAESAARHAYNELQRMLEKLKELIDLYYRLLQEANQKAEDLKSKNLEPTTLTLTVNTTRCFVGDYIAISGALSANGGALENRQVKLFLDDKQIATVNTNQNGAYSAKIQVPYRYVNQIRINAKYNPEGSDQNRYLASTSNTVKVQVLFYKTLMQVSVSDHAYPGLPLTISGKVTSQDGTPLAERHISVYFDNTLKTQVKSDLNGQFNAQFTIDAQTTTGNHTLKITTEASNRYASATEERTITVTKKATHLTVNSPTFILLPTELQVAGTVTSASGPLKDATVKLDFINFTATTKTLDDGSFNLTLSVPLNAAIGGYQELTLKAQPTQPWQAAAQTQISIFTLNSVGTGAAFASSLSIFAVAFLKFAKTKKSTASTAATETLSSQSFNITQKQDPTLTSTALTSENKFLGERGKILKAYTEAATTVQEATGNALTANMTLREYVSLTKQKIGEAAQAFAELTGLAEKSLYSPHTPTLEETKKAEDLTKTIRGILSAATH